MEEEKGQLASRREVVGVLDCNLLKDQEKECAIPPPRMVMSSFFTSG